VSDKLGNRGPHFLIVGSARSGTTLVQRLACELPGVAMPPETHFFDLFVPGLLRRGAPPLHGRRLREEIEHWRRMEQVRGLDVDVAAVARDLGEHCDSVMELFDALLRHLVGPSRHYGEKTPNHLWWWRPLTDARPSMKIIAVVRDPRSVVSSNLAAPWASAISDWNWRNDLYVAMAERWRVEQEQVLAMVEALGPRCTVLRYEDVVSDPTASRRAIARLIGIDDTAALTARPGPPASIVLPWETWKADALTEVHPRRVDAWQADLGGRRGRVVSAVCAPVMGRLGYRRSTRERIGDVLVSATLHPLTHRRRRAYRRQLLHEIESITGVTV
jgi:Sulfotransferase family